MCDCHFRALYRGHGLFKVACLLEAVHPNDGHPLAGKVLKLRKEADPEPKLFAEHVDSGVYPRIFAAAPVSELVSVAQPVSQWNGWITDLAVPLDQALRQPGLSREAVGRCIVGAVRCMLRAARHGHSMDDPCLCNFGLLGGDVVIIDAGRSPPFDEKPLLSVAMARQHASPDNMLIVTYVNANRVNFALTWVRPLEAQQQPHRRAAAAARGVAAKPRRVAAPAP